MLNLFFFQFFRTYYRLFVQVIFFYFVSKLHIKDISIFSHFICWFFPFIFLPFFNYVIFSQVLHHLLVQSFQLLFRKWSVNVSIKEFFIFFLVNDFPFFLVCLVCEIIYIFVELKFSVSFFSWIFMKMPKRKGVRGTIIKWRVWYPKILQSINIEKKQNTFPNFFLSLTCVNLIFFGVFFCFPTTFLLHHQKWLS